jgi:hypothetical protein
LRLAFLRARAIWRENSGSVSLPVHQALAFRALHGLHRPVNIAVAELNAVIVAEVKFCRVAVQVLFLAVLVDAAHVALEDREIAFRRIDVDVAARVFLGAVIDGFVRELRCANPSS